MFKPCNWNLVEIKNIYLKSSNVLNNVNNPVSCFKMVCAYERKQHLGDIVVWIFVPLITIDLIIDGRRNSHTF